MASANLPFYVALAFTVGLTVMYQDSKASDTCSAEYMRIINDASIPDIAAKVTRWEALQSKCASSGLYEFRLGLLYSQAKRFDDAKMALDRGSKTKGSPAREYQYAYAELELAKGNIPQAQSRYEKLRVDYPDWYLPYFSLGQISVAQQKYAVAKSYFEESLQHEPHAETYGFLATCTHQLGLDKETIEYMNKALAADPSMAGYRNGMIAAALSAIKLGQLQHATNALALLVKAKPEVKNDAEFLRLIAVLKEKLQRGQ